MEMTLNRRLTVNVERAAFYGVIGAIIAAVFTAVNGVYKTWREAALASKNAELAELREYRKELKTEMHDLRVRLNDMEAKLAKSTAEIQEWRGHFVGILFKLEGILALQDATLVTGHLQHIVIYLRRILEMDVGEPERRMKMIGHEEG